MNNELTLSLFDFDFGGGSSSRGRVSEAEPTEIDENGNYRDSNARHNSYRDGSGGGGNGGGSGGGGGRVKGAIIVACVLIILFVSYQAGLFKFISFSKDPAENLASMLNAVDYNHEIVSKGDGTYGDSVYERDVIYDSGSILKMPDNLYMVYFFTGDELVDKEFNDWVIENEANYMIYRVNQKELGDYKYYNTGFVDGKNRPFILLVDGRYVPSKEVDFAVDKMSLLDLAQQYDEMVRDMRN